MVVIDVKTPPRTSRASDRCPSSGQVYNGPFPLVSFPALHAESKIIDCPSCGRPVTVQEPNNRIASHGTVETRNTRAWDEKLRGYRTYGIR